MVMRHFCSALLMIYLWRYASVQLPPLENLVNFGQKCRCYGGRRHPQGKHSRFIAEFRVAKTLSRTDEVHNAINLLRSILGSVKHRPST